VAIPTPPRTLTGQGVAHQRKVGSYVTGVTPESDFGVFGALFDIHVLELTGLEDLAALYTLHELGIFVAADDLHARMFARLLRTCILRGSGRLGFHISGLHVRNIG